MKIFLPSTSARSFLCWVFILGFAAAAGASATARRIALAEFASGTVVRVDVLTEDGQVERSLDLSLPPVPFTKIGCKARIQGVVIVETELDRAGRPFRSRVTKGLPMGLNDHVLRSLEHEWEFPADVEGPLRIEVRFEIHEDVEPEDLVAAWPDSPLPSISACNHDPASSLWEIADALRSRVDDGQLSRETLRSRVGGDEWHSWVPKIALVPRDHRPTLAAMTESRHLKTIACPAAERLFSLDVEAGDVAPEPKDSYSAHYVLQAIATSEDLSALTSAAPQITLSSDREIAEVVFDQMRIFAFGPGYSRMCGRWKRRTRSSA